MQLSMHQATVMLFVDLMQSSNDRSLDFSEPGDPNLEDFNPPTKRFKPPILSWTKLQRVHAWKHQKCNAWAMNLFLDWKDQRTKDHIILVNVAQAIF